MTSDYEDSSSTPEKLTLLVFIAAIVIGNVSIIYLINRDKLILIHVDLCICYVYRTCKWKTLVKYICIRDGIH